VEGVSTRKVDDLLQALGLTRIDKGKVSRICKELDAVWRPSATGLWMREIPDGLRFHRRRRI
jgi:transposase-like protein